MRYMFIMTVRASVSFINRDRAFARRWMQQGIFKPVNAFVAAGLQALKDKHEERSLALGVMAEVIRQRDRTPHEEFVDFDAEALLHRMDGGNAGQCRTDR